MDTVVLDEIEPGITRVTLDRPERLNAMNHELVADLHRALDEAATDRACRVVILTGAGRGFCAGLDLRGTGDAPGADGLGAAAGGFTAQQHIATLVPHLRSLRQPVIAAVNGAAAGGGLALALACDVRIAGTSARFNVAFVRIGLSGCDIGVSLAAPTARGGEPCLRAHADGPPGRRHRSGRHRPRGEGRPGRRAGRIGAGHGAPDRRQTAPLACG